MSMENGISNKDEIIDNQATGVTEKSAELPLNDNLGHISDSAATQPPYLDEHEFNIRLADNDDYEGLTFEVIEAEGAEGQQVVSRGVYLAPNLITTLSLLSGFYSILASTSGEFYKAALAIFLSAILDGADGRVARMLNAQSPFGEQYDSLADLLAFGIAPAILVYSFALEPLGRIGLGCAFVFTACGAVRLARFNVQVGIVDKKYFVGLASPLAAILVTAAVMVAIDHNEWVGQYDTLIMIFDLYFLVDRINSLMVFM